MPDTTIYDLPYPASSDPPDGPTQFQALADRLEIVLATLQPVLGDFKDSAQIASHGRWLLCDVEREMSRVEIEAELGLDSGEAQALVDLLVTGSGSAYGSAAASKVKIPGFAGVVSLPVSGSHPKTGAGSVGGAETHTLTGPESGVQAHTHTADQSAHSHTDGSLSAASDGAHAHTHSAIGSLAAAGSGTAIIQALASGTDGNTADYFTTSNGAHTHSVTGTTDTADPAITVANATAVSGSAHNNMPPFRVKGHCFIRV